MEECIFCKEQIESKSIDPLKRIFEVFCEKCGFYLISNQAYNKLEKDEKLKVKIFAVIMHRKIMNQSPVFILSVENDKNQYSEFPGYETILKVSINDLERGFPKLIYDRIDKILLNIKNISEYFGYKIMILEQDYSKFFCDSSKSESLSFIISQLAQMEYIQLYDTSKIFNPRFPLNICLTPKGWKRVEDIEQGKNILSKQVFVAMSFNAKLNSAYEKGIKQAILDLDLNPHRIDENEQNEDICDAIIIEIKKSRFLVCDLTDQRGGVYFEGGYGKGLGRSIIWTCKKDEIDKVHFDINHNNIILWKSEEELCIKLKKRIQATIL